MPPAWRIYYADGEIFDSERGSPLDAPPYGVVCIIGPTQNPSDPSYRMHRWDRYYWNPVVQQWWGGDRDVADQRLANGDPIEAIKFGVMVDTPDYLNILERADIERREIFGGSGGDYMDQGSNFKHRGVTD